MKKGEKLDNFDGNGDPLLTDWKAVESFMYTYYPSQSFIGEKIAKHDYLNIVKGTIARSSAENILTSPYFAHIKNSIDAADKFLSNPGNKTLVKTSVKKNGMHDHWEFIIVDKGEKLDKFDGNGNPLLTDWRALYNFAYFFLDIFGILSSNNSFKIAKDYMDSLVDHQPDGRTHQKNANEARAYFTQPNKTLIKTYGYDEYGQPCWKFECLNKSANLSGYEGKIVSRDKEAFIDYLNCAAGVYEPWRSGIAG